MEWVGLSNGAVLTGAGAALAGGLALAGVLISTGSANHRSREALVSTAEDRHQIDVRERESDCHSPFSTITGQLASDKASVRMGLMHEVVTGRVRQLDWRVAS